jgi:hypothetical protein
MLGHKGKLRFIQTAEGLMVELPDKISDISDLTCSLRITGSNLKPAQQPVNPSAR